MDMFETLAVSLIVSTALLVMGARAYRNLKQAGDPATPDACGGCGGCACTEKNPTETSK